MFDIEEALKTYPRHEVLPVIQYLNFESLLFQTRYFFRMNQRRRFVVGDHHVLISEALERVFSGKTTRLIINLPPRYSKTEIAVKNFIAKGLSLNAAAKFIHTSYSKALALDNSEAVKELVQSEAYQELYPSVQVKKDSKAKEKWYTTAGGGVYATSSGGQITGFGAGAVDDDESDLYDEQLQADQHFIGEMISEIDAAYESLDDKFKFAGAIVIDDPNKPDDAESETRRERVNERFDSTIKSRVNSRKTPIIIIQQRIHRRDLSGYLMEQDPEGWEVLCLPAIQEYKDENGVMQQKALWPHKHTLEELLKLQKDNELVFARQYQQKGASKAGLLFPEDELNFYDPKAFDPVEKREYSCCYVDPSDTGGDDLSAPFTTKVGTRIYLHDIIYNTAGTDFNLEAISDMAISRKMNALECEGNGGWVQFGKDLRRTINDRPPIGKGCATCEVRILSNSTHKHTRIMAAAAFIKKYFWFRSDWKSIPEYRKFMECLLEYNKIQEGLTKNKHDDAPDSLSGIARHYRTNFPDLM